MIPATPPVPDGATVSPEALSVWRLLRVAHSAAIVAMARSSPDGGWTRDAMGSPAASVHPEPRLCWVESPNGLWPAAVLRVTFEGQTRRVVVSPRVSGPHFVQTLECNHDAGEWVNA